MNGALHSLDCLRPNPDWAKLPLFDRKGWKRVRFGDAVRMLKEQVDPQSGEVDRYVAGEHMETENVHIRKWGAVGDVYLGPAFVRRFHKGQVLYGSRRTYLKKVSLAEFDGVTANTTFVLQADEKILLQELLPWLMLSERFTQHSIRESKGSTNPYINFPDIAKFEFDLPPLDQQRRIAEILWTIDETAEHWCKTKDDGVAAYTLKLKTMILGVVDGGKQNISDIDEFSLPCGWFLQRAKDLVVSPITKGATPSPHLNTKTANIPFLKVYNLTFTGVLDFSVDPTYVEKRVHQTDLKRSQVHSGDILMNLVGPPLGKTALIPEGFPEANINQAIAIYRIEDSVLREFFLEYLRSDLAQRWLERRSKKTSGQRNLTLALAQDLPVPIPPAEVISEVVGTARSFSTMLREINLALEAASRLSQSIVNQLWS